MDSSAGARFQHVKDTNIGHIAILDSSFGNITVKSGIWLKDRKVAA